MINFELTDEELLLIKTECDFANMSVNELIITAETQGQLLRKLNELSTRDSLTGLYNNSAVRSLIQTFLKNDGKDGTHCLMFLDIDNFKYINDNFGHLFGDDVLSEFSNKISEICSSFDCILGRTGGDEFLILIKFATISEIKAVAVKICSAFYSICGGELCSDVSCSIGISLYPENAECYTSLVEYADRALYRSKKLGKNCFTIYSKDFDDKI